MTVTDNGGPKPKPFGSRAPCFIGAESYDSSPGEGIFDRMGNGGPEASAKAEVELTGLLVAAVWYEMPVFLLSDVEDEYSAPNASELLSLVN